MASPKTDALLQRQMKAGGTQESVSAVFRLRPHKAKDLALPAEETEATTRQVLERVTGSVGEPPDRFHVFPSFGSFSVSAKPRFLQELLDQPEIVSAAANRREDDLQIQPVPAAPRARGTKASKKAPR
jgi:hypothetical protein